MNKYDNKNLHELEQMYMDACNHNDLTLVKDLLNNSKLKTGINPQVIRDSLSLLNKNSKQTTAQLLHTKILENPPLYLYIEGFIDYVKGQEKDNDLLANISELTTEKHVELVRKFIKYGEADKVEYLLTLPDVERFVKNYSFQENLILKAVDFGQAEVVQVLLSPNIKKYLDIHKNDDIAFREACGYGYTDIVNQLLNPDDFSDRPNIYKHYDTVLNKASTNGHLDTVKILVESASFLNEQPGIETAFKSACTNNHHQIVKYFLDSPECNEHITHNTCEMAFREACSRGHLELAQTLNSVDFLKQAAISHSVKYSILNKHPHVTNYLLEFPDIRLYLSPQDWLGSVKVACANGYVDIIDKIFELHNPNSQFSLKNEMFIRECFKIASQNNEPDVIKYFLTNDEFKKFIPEDDYQLAFNNACFKGNINLANYLLNSPKIDKHATVNGSLQERNEHGYNNGIIAAIKGKQVEMLQFLIFDMDAKKSKSISRFLKFHPDENAKKFFAIKAASNTLKNELQPNDSEPITKRSPKL